ncbi:MAG: M24 family metallopeptidase, partial [Christensenella sp.]|uniref:M24 family metallopeptidase n=1 Tax=Christensenella sp. TaxID=1935934 RepID=UPI002B1F7DA7
AIKYNKSALELKLTKEAALITDVMLEGMLSVLSPGMYETQVAAWGALIAHELGVEELAYPVMVTSGKNNWTLVGKASNRIIGEGDIVHVGAGAKRDGLSGSTRMSVMCVKDESGLTEEYKKNMAFLEDAFTYSVDKFEEIAKEDLDGREHERAMVEYYNARAAEFVGVDGKPIENFARLKGYATMHNTGYTECQEFYGALTDDYTGKLPQNMAFMLDAGLQGFDKSWDDVVMDWEYIVIEKTLGKTGKDVEMFNQLPLNVQRFVGRGF